MKIFMPFKIKDIGGTSAFAQKFKAGLELQGHEVFFNFREDYDLLFLIVQCPFKHIWYAKKKNKKIIQRLDGVYYWSVAGWRYPLMNLKAVLIRHLFADFTIYQSKYSKYCAEKFLGEKGDEKSEVIYNGVDLNIFSSHGDKINLRDNSEQGIFFTASEFRRKDQLAPMLKALEIYYDKFNKNFKLVIAGSFSRELSDFPERCGLKYVKFIGKIKNSDLPKYERSSDVFLFTHLNPPCPNNIIEAMACGLPICGVADGSMREITEDKKNSLLTEAKGDAFWNNRQHDYVKFADNLNKLIKNKLIFSSQSRQIAQKKFSLDIMIEKYLKIINKFA